MPLKKLDSVGEGWEFGFRFKSQLRPIVYLFKKRKEKCNNNYPYTIRVGRLNNSLFFLKQVCSVCWGIGRCFCIMLTWLLLLGT